MPVLEFESPIRLAGFLNHNGFERVVAPEVCGQRFGFNLTTHTFAATYIGDGDALRSVQNARGSCLLLFAFAAGFFGRCFSVGFCLCFYSGFSSSGSQFATPLWLVRF